ncbi:hypothetical protein OSB04_005358 [Centaurea solstitialis]|uniref:Uncharacterized protein n=1 Tax=Centaurea solstitialis TaxID=347529 RepID=A0AA38U0I3_9ASTR|nr:hypothetical protein OSB04_005358 [Centaurea solstitialis]
MTTSKRTFRMFIEEELGEFPHFVVWAVLEWMLIISLYLDGFLSCIANKFADVFELDPPCVLCTRVDHALGGKNPNLYYNESICESHKKDISSLAYCHVHRKLSDIRNMCDGCLLSFATDKDSDSDSNKQKDDEGKAEDDQKKAAAELAEKKVKDSSKNEVVDENRCSCCGECLKPKQVTKEASKEVSRVLSNFRAPSLLSSNSPRASSSMFPNSSPRAFSSSLFPNSSPRATSLFPNSSPRAFSSSLFPNSSPRAFSSSLFPNSSPRASSLFPSSSPKASSLFPNSSPRASSLFPSLSPRASSMFPSSSPRASSLFPSLSPRASSLFPNSSPRTYSLPPLASPRTWKIDDSRYSEYSHPRFNEFKFASDHEPDMHDDDYGSHINTKETKDTKSGNDSEEPNEDSGKTPGYIKGNKFFGIPLNESIAGSPRWAASKPPKKGSTDKPETFSEPWKNRQRPTTKPSFSN